MNETARPDGEQLELVEGSLAAELDERSWDEWFRALPVTPGATVTVAEQHASDPAHDEPSRP